MGVKEVVGGYDLMGVNYDSLATQGIWTML